MQSSDRHSDQRSGHPARAPQLAQQTCLAALLTLCQSFADRNGQTRAAFHERDVACYTV